MFLSRSLQLCESIKNVLFDYDSIVFFALLPILVWPSTWASETCRSFNMCCTPRGNSWECRSECACVHVSVTRSENLTIRLQYGIRRVKVSNSAIKVNLIVEHQAMMNMCGPGFRQISFGENIIS